MEDFNKYTSSINFAPIVDFVLANGKLVTLKKGEYFTRQGEVCKTMGFVTSGSFRYCSVNSKGENNIVGYTFEDSFVGNYPAFQLQDKSNVDIQALCDCKVYTLTYPQLSDFYNLNNDYQRLGRHIAETLLWEVYERMISMYTLTAEERYLDLLTRCPGLFRLITLKELASFLMVRPETLSRIRKKVTEKPIS